MFVEGKQFNHTIEWRLSKRPLIAVWGEVHIFKAKKNIVLYVSYFVNNRRRC